MSDYYNGLSEADKVRYSAKLCVNGVEYGDPYGVDASEWTLTGQQWPPVSMVNITLYLLFTPSRFTPETLQAYKSLEAYNYFVSGHVRDIRLWQPGRHQLCFVRANVKPSQRVTGPPHDAWVCLDHTTGRVRSGHCTCKAGLGEVCSHVAALLFSAEYSARVSQETSCTSQPCAWTRSTTRMEDMVPVHQLDLSKPGMPSRLLPDEPDHVSNDFENKDRALFQEIYRVNPQAVVLRSIPKMDDEDTDSASEDEQSYTFLRKVRRTGATRTSLAHDMFVPLSEIDRIEKSTRQQATTLLWREVRYGRITASIVHKVQTMRQTTSPKAVLDMLLLRSPPVTTEATRWGIEKEPVAKEAYRELMKTRHRDFMLCDVGFVIDMKDNFLGASPDGIWTCSCHGVGTLEVKCPWSLRHEGSIVSDYECLTADMQLKESHKHFTQVQTQLHVCRKEVAHFFVWTPNDWDVIVVPINTSFYAPVLEKARAFWALHVVPELL